MAPEFDPRELNISKRISPKKIRAMEKGKRNSDDPICVLRDFDGEEYVVDGNHRTAFARRRGTHIQGEYVADDDRIGNQTAFQRVLNIFFRD
jgi:hypothetical protein